MIPDCEVLLNRVHKSYSGSKIYMQLVYNNDQTNLYYDQIPRLGSFEVSLNGVLLYSKIKSKLWPNIKSVATRLANVCLDLHNGIPLKTHTTKGTYIKRNKPTLATLPTLYSNRNLKSL